MIKKAAFAALCLLATSPAFAQTEGWASVGGGINVNGGRFTGQARLGLDTSLGETMFVGFGIGIGANGAKDCAIFTGVRVCVKGEQEYSAEGRLGAVTKGGSKIYVIGGYSNLGLKADGSQNNVKVSVDLPSLDGFMVGAGYQVTLGKKAFFRTEYRYGSYSDGVSTHAFMPSIGLKF
jgi:hypothetical protein